MSDPKAPKLSKWPFYAADLFLLLMAGWVAYQSPVPLALGPAGLVAALCIAGAWLSITPFLMQYKAALKVAEAGALTTVVEQVNDLRTLANQISFATAQWQVVQDQSSQTVKASHEIAERMTREAQNFSAFMQKANDSEKAHLRLEVDKLRRGEGEWLESSVRLLDHVYAIYQAGLRSGQDRLAQQLGTFQHSCRESMRRVGLTIVEPKADEIYDETLHQIVEATAKAAPGARIRATIATGYRYQGQLVRLPLVEVTETVAEGTSPEPDVLQPAAGTDGSPGQS